MASYDFRFFVAGSPERVQEVHIFDNDQQATCRAASELLQMPGRIAVEVWSGEGLVYARRRGSQPSPDQLAPL